MIYRLLDTSDLGELETSDLLGELDDGSGVFDTLWSIRRTLDTRNRFVSTTFRSDRFSTSSTISAQLASSAASGSIGVGSKFDIWHLGCVCVYVSYNIIFLDVRVGTEVVFFLCSYMS